MTLRTTHEGIEWSLDTLFSLQAACERYLSRRDSVTAHKVITSASVKRSPAGPAFIMKTIFESFSQHRGVARIIILRWR